MAYIPIGAHWYLAEMIVEFRFADEPGRMAHINHVLVESTSPEEAYAAALELGKQYDMQYTNTDGELVTCTFKGLRDLNVIHDELKHGAELIYELQEGLSPDEVDELVSPRESLGIFAPITAPTHEPSKETEV